VTQPEFVSDLVSTAKQLLLDTGKLVDTLSQDFMEVQGTSGGAVKQTLMFTVGMLSSYMSLPSVYAQTLNRFSL
jgi:hypothetical protein